MKSAIRDFRKEVSKILGEKISAAVKEFLGERETDLEELMALGEALRELEGQRDDIVKTQTEEARKFLPSNKILNDCVLKTAHIEKNIRQKQKEIDGLLSKLTKVPDSFLEGYKFSKLLQKS